MKFLFQLREKDTDQSRDLKLDQEVGLAPALGRETQPQILGTLESENPGRHRLPVIVGTGQIADRLHPQEATPYQATSNHEETEENLEVLQDLPREIEAETDEAHRPKHLNMSGLVPSKSLILQTRVI